MVRYGGGEGKGVIRMTPSLRRAGRGSAGLLEPRRPAPNSVWGREGVGLGVPSNSGVAFSSFV